MEGEGIQGRGERRGRLARREGRVEREIGQGRGEKGDVEKKTGRERREMGKGRQYEGGVGRWGEVN